MKERMNEGNENGGTDGSSRPDVGTSSSPRACALFVEFLPCFTSALAVLFIAGSLHNAPSLQVFYRHPLSKRQYRACGYFAYGPLYNERTYELFPIVGSMHRRCERARFRRSFFSLFLISFRSAMQQLARSASNRIGARTRVSRNVNHYRAR